MGLSTTAFFGYFGGYTASETLEIRTTLLNLMAISDRLPASN